MVDQVPASTTADPETSNVVVTLQDRGQLDGLFNHDDQVCATVNAAEVVGLALDNPGMKTKDLRALWPKTTVTLADADGTTVAIEELGLAGGKFEEGTGCTWPVEFLDVEASDFYTVTFVHGDFTTSTEIEGGSDVAVDLTF